MAHIGGNRTSHAAQPNSPAAKGKALQTYGLRFLLCSTLLTPTTVMAANTTWTGNASTSWTAAGNWTPSVPVAGDNATIPFAPNFPVIGSGIIANLNSVSVSNSNINSPASLTILGGGKLTVNGLGLGGASTATSNLTVSGSNSSLTVSGNANVGSGGSARGNLLVDAGGAFSTGQAFIGGGGANTGSGTVTGANSSWKSTGNFIIGFYGTGDFTFSNGATANAADTIVGLNTNDSNNITPSGGAVGTLDIQSGSRFNGANLTAGGNAKTNGTVNVTGQNSALTLSGAQIIGNRGSGSLQILDGATVTAPSRTYVGNNAGSSGTVLISGLNSTLDTSTGINLGEAGVGSMTVSNGGKVKTGNAWLGNIVNGAGVTPSSGTLLIDGNQSRWDGTGVLSVGFNSSGRLTISNGAIADIKGTSTVGNNAGSTGEATVTGSGQWLSVALTVGNAGTGTLTVSDGGVVSGLNSSVGSSPSSNGKVTVTGQGSSWTSTREQTIAGNGSATLDILNGAKVEGETVKIGESSNSRGTVTVQGTGSTWTSTSVMNVGLRGSGKVTVSDGGRVVNKQEDSLGNYSGAYGAVEVTGAQSRWETTGRMLIADDGQGDLTVEKGGYASAGSSTLGNGSGSNASATVRDAGSTWSVGNLTVGNGGNAVLAVSAGGKVSSVSSSVAEQVASKGDVTVSGAGSSWTTDGDLTIGGSGTGVVTLSSQGQISAANTRIAATAGSTGTLNIGAAAGAAAAQAGQLATSSISFGSGTGTLVLNHTDSAYDLSAAISGAGTIDAENGRTLLLADSSGFTGTTAIASAATVQVGNGGTSGALGGSVVNNGNFAHDRADDVAYTGQMSGAGTFTKTGAGTLSLTGDSSAFTGSTLLTTGGLAVTGKLGGSVTAQGGTVLSGTGSLGSVTADKGSTIAPGSASGTDAATLSLTGNFRQLSGSTYQAELLPQTAKSDLISVNGSATLESGAILNVTNRGAQPYGIHDVYTVLTAAGGVSGTYLLSGDTAISAFYELQAVYEANAVLLQAVQIRDFSDVAFTENQTGAADGLGSLPQGNEVRDAVGNLDNDAAVRQALDLLSGEIYASTAGAILEDGRFLRDAVLGRLRCDAHGADTSNRRDCFARSVWIEGYGATGDNDGDGNAAAMDTQIEGFYLGADMPLMDKGRIGLFAGHGRSDVTVDARRSGASVESYDFGAYGSAQWNDLGLRLGASYGWNDVTTSRQVAFDGFSDSLSADYTAHAAQVFGELGYALAAGPAAFQPFGSLAYVNVHSDAFTESGGAAALSSEAQDTSLTLSTLGLRASAAAQVFDFEVKANGMAGWQHAWGDLSPDVAFSFEGGSSFGIQGVPAAEDAAVLEAGLTVEAPGEGAFGVWYTGQFSSDTQNQGLRANLSFNF